MYSDVVGWNSLCCCLVGLILCNPMDCSPPGSSIHGISQARIPGWVAISFSRGSSQPRDRLNPHLLHCRRILCHCATREARQLPTCRCHSYPAVESSVSLMIFYRLDLSVTDREMLMSSIIILDLSFFPL